jgi:hypothetical protein
MDHPVVDSILAARPSTKQMKNRAASPCWILFSVLLLASGSGRAQIHHQELGTAFTAGNSGDGASTADLGLSATDGAPEVLFEGFESGLPPSPGPTAETNYTLASGVWAVRNAYQNSDLTFVHGGAHSAYIKKSSTGYLTTPNIASGGVGTVSFWARCTATPTVNNLFISKAVAGGGFSTVGSVMVTGTAVTQYSVPVNDPSANVRIRFATNNVNNVVIDDVSITGNPNAITLSQGILPDFGNVKIGRAHV